MTFTQSILSRFNNYTNFKDRSSRSEHWNWVLFTVVSAIVLSFVELFVLDYDWGILRGIFSIITLIPNLSMGVRRFHDIDKSGWWILL